MLCMDELCGCECCLYLNYVNVNAVYEYCECVWILYSQCFEFLAVELVNPVCVFFKKIQTNLRWLDLDHRRLTYVIYEG
jgi:hypothetical protein